MATAKELGLDSLEGWQLVEDGPIQRGDLRVIQWPDDVWFSDITIGEDVQWVAWNGTRTYRRIPVANHKDVADERTKALIAESMPFVVEGTSLNVVPAKAATHDEGKPPLGHLPWDAIDEMAMVMLYGIEKYKDGDNYRLGMEVRRNLGCAMRHISKYLRGEDLDKESGRNHLGHAMCRIAFVLQNIADGTVVDDRYRAKK